MILYYGTSPQYAERLLEQGWKPSDKKFRGHHGGNSQLLYLTNMPEDAAWFGDVVLGVRVPDPSRLKVDPEDGIGETVKEELNNSLGLPGKVVYDQAIPASNFRIFQ